MVPTTPAWKLKATHAALIPRDLLQNLLWMKCFPLGNPHNFYLPELLSLYYIIARRVFKMIRLQPHEE